MSTEAARLLRGPKVALTEQQRAEYLAFAVNAARRSGSVITPHFRRLTAIENKLEGQVGAPGGAVPTGERYDPVTVADRAAEEFLRQEINQRYPDHGILGEEFPHQPGNGLHWVLDPVDGTRAFVTGFLHWGTLVALFDGEDVVCGVMHQPVMGELFYGNGDSAEYRNGERAAVPLSTRACSSLAEAVVGTTHPGCFPEPGQWDAFQGLVDCCQMLRYGGDCYGYGMVAMGHLDLVVEAGLNPYDIQALIPIVRGAGGVITDWQGGNPALGGTVIAAGDARIHEQALRALNDR